MATLASSFKVLSSSPIPDAIAKLQIITCDICRTSKASRDVLVEGFIKGTAALKRCCDSCTKSLA